MLYLVLLTLAAVQAQRPTISPDIINEIFDIPNKGGNLEDITVRPTDKPASFVDANGNPCQCVPYFLCDNDLNAIDANNASVTGFGTLDIRFREDDCQESTERCCKNPKKEEDVVTPKPDLEKIHRGCGYRRLGGIDFTITGGNGNEAGFGEFPWVVAVINNQNDSYAGVGVLIHPRVVMTGAHIADHYAASGALKIRAGEWDTQTFKERLKYQERVVEDIYIHKDFAPKSLKFDMALLLLQEPVELDDHINTLCLPRQDEDFSQYKGCIANGWGKDKFGQQGRYAVILKKVEINMVGHARCQELLRRTRLGSGFKLHGSFVCAGGEAGKDTCQGDGGAPLACPIGDDRYKLTGLVAWGIGCGGKDVPAVYAAVAQFRGWTDNKMAEWGLDTSSYNI